MKKITAVILALLLLMGGGALADNALNRGNTLNYSYL